MMSLIAHEIRTPINCVINLIENVKRDFNPEQSKLVSRLQEQLKDLGMCINILRILLETCTSILDFLTPGTKSIKWTEFDITQIISDTKLLFDIPLKDKGLNLTIEIAQDFENLVKSDPTRLRQIVINLISNAIKYTKKGSITIAITRIENDKAIRIEVKDTGLGIKKEDQLKLFREFGKIKNK